jgi:hypothetical protein
MEGRQMTHATKVFVYAAALVLCLCGNSVDYANATSTLWHLDDVKLDDGAMATGSFEYTSGQFDLTNFDIKVSGGGLPTFEYTPANSSARSSPDCVIEHRGVCFGKQQSTFFFLKGGGHRTLLLNTLPFDGTAQRLSLAGPPEPGALVPQDSREEIVRRITEGSVGPGTAPNTWKFVGVRFDDGGTVTGSFLWDRTSTELSHFHVVTTPGVALPVSHYTPDNGHAHGDSYRPAFFADFFGSTSTLVFIYASPFSDTGAPILTTGEHSIEFVGRTVADGMLVGAVVPEPRVLIFTMLGFIALLTFSPRRKLKF